MGVDKYSLHNNTYHWTMKIKPVNANLGTYIDFEFVSSYEDPKFEVSHHAGVPN